MNRIPLLISTSVDSFLRHMFKRCLPALHIYLFSGMVALSKRIIVGFIVFQLQATIKSSLNGLSSKQDHPRSNRRGRKCFQVLNFQQYNPKLEETKVINKTKQITCITVTQKCFKGKISSNISDSSITWPIHVSFMPMPCQHLFVLDLHYH